MISVDCSLQQHHLDSCQRHNVHLAESVPDLSFWEVRRTNGIFSFVHVSQLAENNLRATSGPRRRPTYWAVPWRNSPPASLSTRPRARCPEPARSARRLTRSAQPTQVLHTFHLCCTRLWSVTYIHTQHVNWHTSVCASPKGNCTLNCKHERSKAYLCGE